MRIVFEMENQRVLVMILAGGVGERLKPLTEDRCKPAVPFGGRFRIVDFVLSNFINSKIFAIYVIVQYKAQSLIEHLRRGWRFGSLLQDHFVAVVPPQMRMGGDWYRGTADAIYQNVNLIKDFNPDLVAIFGADHIYRMDIRQMIDYHLEREAEVTVSSIPKPLKSARSFGVIGTDGEGRVVGFEEKPRDPRPMTGNPDQSLVSMGNYLFNPEVLLDFLREDATRESAHDFGKTALPLLFKTNRVYAYNFATNHIPGLRGYEEKGYWRDVGTIKEYWEAHMDLLGDRPLLDLGNWAWPIQSVNYGGVPGKICHAEVENSMISDGAVVLGGRVANSVLGVGVVVEEGCTIEGSVIMDHVVIGRGSQIRRAIIDKYNTIPSDSVINSASQKGVPRAHTDSSGVVIVPREWGKGESLSWQNRA